MYLDVQRCPEFQASLEDPDCLSDLLPEALEVLGDHGDPVSLPLDCLSLLFLLRDLFLLGGRFVH